MILCKTAAGQLVLRDRSIALSPRQRSAFILFDGQRSVAEVLTACMGLVQEDVQRLLDLGLLRRRGTGSTGESEASSAGEVAEAKVGKVATDDAALTPRVAQSPAERYQAAYPLATQLTASLGLRGFKLNLQVEAAQGVDDLASLLPRIRAAVGTERCAPLDRALGIEGSSNHGYLEHSGT